MPTIARYEEHADWYEEFARPAAESHRSALHRILGQGTGWCLDLGCGTGHYVDILRATGRSVVGIDLARAQLRHAQRREQRIAQASVTRLPFRDDAFSTVVALWVSTDVDDFGALCREAARVLQSGGAFLFYGVHPCFNGPCVENRDDGARIIHPMYRGSGWHEVSPWWGEAGIRRRVGMRHVPLGELFDDIIRAGLRISRVEEPGSDGIPYTLSIQARRD